MTELLTLPPVLFAGPHAAPPAVLADARPASHRSAVAFAAQESDQEQVDRLIETGGAAVAALALRLRRGEITKSQFITEATATLRAHALTAAELVSSPQAMQPAVAQLLDTRQQYLDGFADDIAGGDLTAKAIAARAALWGGLVHTAWQLARTQDAKDNAVPGERLSITWVCKDDPASCDDCTSLAEGSPYTEDSLPTHPGEDVQCSGNCFPGDTTVLSPAVEKSYRRWYEGPLVEIHTAGGNQLAGTPNHPVLTARGWLPLQLLKPGDCVFSSRLGQEVSLGDPDVQRVPASLSEVHDALAVMFPRQRIVGTEHQFHGDGSNGDVEVVATDRLLRDGLVAPLAHPSLNQFLPCADELPALLADAGALRQRFLRVPLAASRGLRGGSEAGALSGASAGHSQRLRLVAITDAVPNALNSSDDGPTSYSPFLGESLDGNAGGVAIRERAGIGIADIDVEPISERHASSAELLLNPALASTDSGGDPQRAFLGFVEADEVIDVRHRDFSGHVYNLQTRTSWYIANGIVAHNCRCELEYETVGSDEADFRRGPAMLLSHATGFTGPAYALGGTR